MNAQPLPGLDRRGEGYRWYQPAAGLNHRLQILQASGLLRSATLAFAAISFGACRSNRFQPTRITMAFWTLYKREFSSYFQSPVAYIVLFGSALIQGYWFTYLVHFIMDANYKEQSVMQIFFNWPLFWFLLIVQVPITPMRVFSEDFKLPPI